MGVVNIDIQRLYTSLRAQSTLTCRDCTVYIFMCVVNIHRHTETVYIFICVVNIDIQTGYIFMCVVNIDIQRLYTSFMCVVNIDIQRL
jgi:hypothetical protein